MGTTVGVGFSDHRNPLKAGKEAVERALTQAAIMRPDFVLVFATVGYKQEALLNAIRKASGGAPVSGCSGEGVITHETATESNFGVSVMVFCSDELRFERFLIEDISDSAAAGETLAGQLNSVAAGDSLACLLFADGLAFNFDPFINSFKRCLTWSLPVFGGLSADNWTARKTYQYHDDLVLSHGLSCILISGQGRLSWGVSHGCIPVGSERTVTRSRENVIHEIDGTPALSALQGYFSEGWQEQWSKASLNLCLGFPAPTEIKGEYGEYVIRYMPSKNDHDGSVAIQSEVAEGTRFWIVRRDKELIRKGLCEVSEKISQDFSGQKPKFILQFECSGRGKVVFREQEKNDLIRSLQQEVGADVPWLGFYTYGEIAPVGGLNCFHNFTSVILAVI